MSNGTERDNEIKLQELILKDCQSKIELSTNAQMHIWHFLVTINLAYFAGIYFLWSKQFDIYSKWITVLSFLILIINLLLSVIYIRENNAIKDDIDQQRRIYRYILPSYKRKSWFKYKDEFNQKNIFWGITNFVVIIFFDLFLLIPLIFISLNWNCYCKVFIILIIAAFHFFTLLYKNKSINSKKKIRWYKRCSFYFELFLISIVLIIFWFCLKVFYLNFICLNTLVCKWL